jgi:hypothetical protein
MGTAPMETVSQHQCFVLSKSARRKLKTPYWFRGAEETGALQSQENFASALAREISRLAD